MNIPWQAFAADTALANENLHIVLVSVPHSMARLQHYQSLLHACELARNQQPHFIIARGILREILGLYLQQSPQVIEFVYGEKGKPSLKNEEIHFNVSHSHEKIIYIFSRQHRVGIDLEYIQREVDYLSIAKRFFSDVEFNYLVSLPVEKLPSAFFDLWTYKEAYAKALGIGVSHFREFSIDVVNELPQLIGSSDAWTIAKLPLMLPYQGAYAVEGKVGDIEFYKIF